MMKLKYIIIVVVVITILFVLKYCIPLPHKVDVNCKEESLVDKVKDNPKAKEFILTKGECKVQSPITITQDNVIFRGKGKTKTIIKATDNTIPVFNIVGAKGVTLTGFTVQGGKQGILVTNGGQLRIFSVLVKDNKDVNLCILGSESTEKINLKSKTFENCPRPQIDPGPEIGALKTTDMQNLTDSKVAMFSMTAATTTSTVESTCTKIDPSTVPGCDVDEAQCNVEDGTHVKICCSDFEGGNSGVIVKSSTVDFSYIDPEVRCISNFNSHEEYGMSVEKDSNLKTENTSLFFTQNGQNENEGLYLKKSNIEFKNSSLVSSNNGHEGIGISRAEIYLNNSHITSNGNATVNTTAFDIVFDRGSNIECDEPSTITATKLEEDFPSGCAPPLQ